MVCKEEEPVCTGDENITYEVVTSSPVKLVEVTNKKGEVTIYKKSKKKNWNPFKISNKIIEKRSVQQIAEYGPPPDGELSDPCDVETETQLPLCPENENIDETSTPVAIREVKRGHAALTILDDEHTMVFKEEKPASPGDDETTMVFKEEKPVCPEDEEPIMVPRTKNHLRVSLHMTSFILSLLLAVIIFVGVKVAFPEVDLQMIGGMSMTGFSVSLLLFQQWFNSCCQCHVLSGEECTCHTLFGVYFGILI
jgi:hypothetical protein